MPKSLQAQLTEIANRRNGDLEKVASASLIRLGNRIIQESPVDSGRFKNNWMSAYGRVNRSTNRVNNGSGSDSSAQLKEKLVDINIGATFLFTNSLPYGYRLEYEGWSAQAKKGMVRVNVLHWKRIVSEEVKKRR